MDVWIYLRCVLLRFEGQRRLDFNFFVRRPPLEVARSNRVVAAEVEDAAAEEDEEEVEKPRLCSFIRSMSEFNFVIVSSSMPTRCL